MVFLRAYGFYRFRIVGKHTKKSEEKKENDTSFLLIS